MRPIHIAGFAQLDHALRDTARDEAEMVQQVTAAALADAGLGRKDVGFTCSGSNDYVMGRAFSFTMALDGLGAWPPIRESHVEMDGAWALYEAWVRLQHGDVDVALAYSFGKSSLGGVAESLTYSLDPYFLAPLEPGPDVLAALQARRMLDVGLATEADFAEAVARAKAAAGRNSQVPDPRDRVGVGQPPLGVEDGPVRTDGAAAIVLKVGGGGPRISGIAHRIDAHQPGARDLATCPSAVLAAEAAGVDVSRLDVAEFHASYSSQVVLLSRVLGLSERTRVNPSGGALAADTPMVSGLVRIGEAARAIRSGQARHALGHASSGPCLQHNLVCALEAE